MKLPKSWASYTDTYTSFLLRVIRNNVSNAYRTSAYILRALTHYGHQKKLPSPLDYDTHFSVTAGSIMAIMLPAAPGAHMLKTELPGPTLICLEVCPQISPMVLHLSSSTW
eukprot:1139299-Pelagomonas_calceolata.AAC.3